MVWVIVWVDGVVDVYEMLQMWLVVFVEVDKCVCEVCKDVDWVVVDVVCVLS